MTAPVASADLHGTAQSGARAVALELVRALAAAHTRCAAGEEDGLHAVRVAIRRLRSWIRAYRPVLEDTLSRKSRRALRALAEATGAAREVEVSLAILDTLPAPPRTRSGHDDLRRRLARELSRRQDDLDDLATSIPRVVNRLTRELSHYLIDVDLDRQPRDVAMGEFTAHALERHGEKLARALESLEVEENSDDEGSEGDALHRARIAAKRLRYIAEQVDAPGADALVGRLTVLQDALGEHRDSRLLAERALAEIGRSARRDARARAKELLAATDSPSAKGGPARPRVRPGLLQVARAAEARADEMLRKFEAEWPRESRATQLRADVRELAANVSQGR